MCTFYQRYVLVGLGLQNALWQWNMFFWLSLGESAQHVPTDTALAPGRLNEGGEGGEGGDTYSVLWRQQAQAAEQGRDKNTTQQGHQNLSQNTVTHRTTIGSLRLSLTCITRCPPMHVSHQKPLKEVLNMDMLEVLRSFSFTRCTMQYVYLPTAFYWLVLLTCSPLKSGAVYVIWVGFQIVTMHVCEYITKG